MDCKPWWHGPTWNIHEINLQIIEDDTDRLTEVLYKISGAVQEKKSKTNTVTLYG